MSESDGIGEGVEGEVRAAVMAAAQIAEQIARHGEHRAREAERDAQAAAAQAEQRLTAERDTARAEVAATRDPGWWDTADLDQAARAYATADTWRDRDPQLAADADRIEERIGDRFGPEARDAVVTAARAGRGTPDAGAGVVPDTAPRVRDASAEAAYARIVAQDTARDTAEAVADRVGAVTTTETIPLPTPSAAPATTTGWDTPERRDAFAAALSNVSDPEGVDARVRLDRSRATPGGAAAGVTPKASARRIRASSPNRDNEIRR